MATIADMVERYKLNPRQRGNVGTHEGQGTTDPVVAAEPRPVGLSAMFDVAIDLGRQIKGAVDLQSRYLARLERNTPVLIRPVGTVVAGGTLDTIDLGGPDQGFYWALETCTIGGQEWDTTAQGSAALYVIAAPQPGQSPGLGACIGGLVSLPGTGSWGAREGILQYPEHLLVAIFNASKSQVYVANAAVSIYNVAAAGGRDVNAML